DERFVELATTPVAAVRREELPALVLVPRRAREQRVVVGDDAAAFTRSNRLFQLQRVDPNVAPRAYGLAVVRRAKRLRGIFEHRETASTGNVEHTVELGGDVLDVDG